jgi:hypothetical protein
MHLGIKFFYLLTGERIKERGGFNILETKCPKTSPKPKTYTQAL